MIKGWRFEAFMIFVAVVMIGQLHDNLNNEKDTDEKIEWTSEVPTA